MSRYTKLMKNDIVDGENICVSLWMQGCPFHCYNCHNPETWDFNGGKEIPTNLAQQILQAISDNGIQRNFSILGGEPLCPENRKEINKIVKIVRKTYPNIKIYIWTGYTLENLQKEKDFVINDILSNIDVLIDGPYIDKQRDITLKLRGSKNQKIRYHGIDF